MFNETHQELAPDFTLRHARFQKGLAALGADALLIHTPVNLLYATGRVFNGFVWIPRNGGPHFFVAKPEPTVDKNTHKIRKPEDIPRILQHIDKLDGCLALEGDELPWSVFTRLSTLSERPAANASSLLRHARAVKTPLEIEIMREGGARHAEAVAGFARLFYPGMTDHVFALECETTIRYAGSLGLFRINGSGMEVFMGTVLAGDNAGAASPYDFALGGAGLDPSLPVGQSGVVLKAGMTVLADIAFNHRGYLTDCSRAFSIGRPDPETMRAHECCMDIQRAVADRARPGAACAELYQLALDKAEAAGFKDNFMGLSHKAKFIGHGTGLYINEWPVLGAKSMHVIEAGQVIAIEPKIVLPGVGAVGVEDTFVITEKGAENITPCRQELVVL